MKPSALMFAALYGIAGAAALAHAMGCGPKAGPAAVATVAQIGVDVCQEAPSIAPPDAGPLVSLVCALYDSTEKTVQVLIDKTVWGNMKQAYYAKNGKLPAGMHLDPKTE